MSEGERRRNGLERGKRVREPEVIFIGGVAVRTHPLPITRARPGSLLDIRPVLLPHLGHVSLSQVLGYAPPLVKYPPGTILVHIPV